MPNPRRGDDERLYAVLGAMDPAGWFRLLEDKRLLVVWRRGEPVIRVIDLDTGEEDQQFPVHVTAAASGTGSVDRAAAVAATNARIAQGFI